MHVTVTLTHSLRYRIWLSLARCWCDPSLFYWSFWCCNLWMLALFTMMSGLFPCSTAFWKIRMWNFQRFLDAKNLFVSHDVTGTSISSGWSSVCSTSPGRFHMQNPHASTQILHSLGGPLWQRPPLCWWQCNGSPAAWTARCKGSAFLFDVLDYISQAKRYSELVLPPEVPKCWLFGGGWQRCCEDYTSSVLKHTHNSGSVFTCRFPFSKKESNANQWLLCLKMVHLQS